MGLSEGALIYGRRLIKREPVTMARLERNYEEHRKALLVASIPVGAAVFLGVSLFYFAAFLVLSDNRTGSFLALYTLLLLIPWVAVLLVRGPLRTQPDVAVLGADMIFTASMVGLLLLPFESPSGVALILSLKMIATAWFFPWSARMQYATAVGTVLLYWTFLLIAGEPMAQVAILHEIFGPLAAAMLAVSGATIADGTRRTIYERDQTLARSQEELCFLLAQAKDSEARLREANTVKSDFVATMSHELRTPLNTIIGYTDLLQDGEFGGLTDEQRDRLEVVRTASRELLDLIEAVLDLNRLDASRIPLHLEEIDLAAFARQVCEGLTVFETKPSVRFDYRTDGSIDSLRTDPLKLKVILKNLVSNALKFTDSGVVSMQVRSLDAGVEVAVSDTGIGIAPEHHRVIFESFRQIHPANTRRHGGVGLGLYIVRRLVDALGGRIHVESELGRGSTFLVWLPARGPYAS